MEKVEEGTKRGKGGRREECICTRKEEEEEKMEREDGERCGEEYKWMG